MNTLPSLILVVLVASSFSAHISRRQTERKRYDGYFVVEVFAETAADKEFLQGYFQENGLDVWASTDSSVTLSLSSDQWSYLKEKLSEASMTFEIKSKNIQGGVDQEMERMWQRSRGQKNEFDYNEFNTYENIISEMDNIVTRCPTGVTCENYVIGSSFEGRDLKVLKMSKEGEGRRALWFDSAVHAREWLSPATLLKIVNHLIESTECDEQVSALVDQYDWYFLPIANPDGYVYSWEQDRYWRKNRMPNEGSSCVGTDMNRNFDSNWGNAGTSTDPCHQTYGGTGPASTPEVQAMQNEALRIGSTLDAWVTIHSYSQMWLTPYGDLNPDGSCHTANNHDDLMTMVNAMADATENTFGTTWTRGTSCIAIYPASGGTEDYAKQSGGVKYTFTPELRGSDFVVPVEEIEPSFREIWQGVLAMLSVIDSIENPQQ